LFLGSAAQHAAPPLAPARRSSPFLIDSRDRAGKMIEVGFRIVATAGMLLIIGLRTGKVSVLITDS
jgi:hypothetical protein